MPEILRLYRDDVSVNYEEEGEEDDRSSRLRREETVDEAVAFWGCERVSASHQACATGLGADGGRNRAHRADGGGTGAPF